MHDQIGKGTDMLVPTLLPDLDEAAQERLRDAHGAVFKAKFLEQAKPFARGRPHLGRPNFPVAPGYLPSGVAVRLTGFDAETLKHFIFLERPQDVRGDDSEAFSQDAYIASRRISA
ncbi:hypothetical protein [Sphingomonas nostoxanthinifaciens]|uniref:hypothetical protein n=1 Tax=Sphingomonas nostoxanthinifaciens TaxID=2872652 RepID=UPI001CC20788|nr:hypothetical protein [Sphingomonas nostoxanthinifaciens]UAK25622.1 hypothetical protein K8P63_05600 [Sphingomonas nostoxanthinifaciens]